MTVGALVACSAFGTRLAIAQTSPGTAGHDGARTTAQLPLRRFDIAAGSLADVLRAFEDASGTTVRVEFDRVVLDSLHSPGVTGLLSDAEALRQLLSESGIRHRFTGRRTVVLTMQTMSDTIDVSAPAPEIASPKFTQPLLDTPRTVAVIPDEVFLAQGATTLRDVLRNTPGITFQAGEGGGGVPGDSFSMRGFSAGNDILLDGVRESGAYTRDAFNLEQVEVVKGPSGAVAGRGGTGGAINLVTKTPKPESFTRAAFGAGNAGYTRVTVDSNAPLDSIGGAAVHMAAMVTSSDVPGRDVVHNSSWGVAPSLSFGIGKPSRFTLAYQHLTQDNVPDYGLPWAAFESDPRADQTNFYGLEGYDYENITNDVATASFERDLSGGWTLRNISRWADNHRDSAITSPRPPNRQLQQRRMDQGQLTNQTSVSGALQTASIQHALVAGVEIGRETTFIRRQAQTTNQPQTNLTDPDPSQSPLGPMPANNGNPEDTSLSLAGIYAFDTLQLGSRWEVTAGLRWDSVGVDYELTNVTTGARTRLGRDDRMLSWSSGIVFKPRANASVYASHATSFNPSVEAAAGGAGLSDVPTSANNVNLAPEKSRNLEVGAKWEMGGGRAIATAALFRTEKTNARTRGVSTEPFVLDGEQRVDGLELGLTGNLTDRWSLLTSYAHLDSEFVASANPLEQGAALAFVPENSFNVWTEGRLPRGFSVGAGAQYMDSVFRNATSTAEVPSYWLLNAMASYDVSRALTLRLNVNNLADEQYVDRVGGGHYVPGPGRSVVVNAEIDF
ncbi:MAG TPA: TonB-dependent siderophore receptor [Thermoanaerobaculia bacterium]|jgi:catecholate siderophore receptor|nr:TonB-dependent siderophore receptor [Thermoanaerobaculia bacterium]